MKKSMFTPFLLVMLLGGICLMLYPTLSDWWNRFCQAQVISGYIQQVERMDDAACEAVRNAAQEYNRFLAGQTEASGECYQDTLDVDGNGVMGYLEIPRLKLLMAVCHGTDEAVLRSSAGHLSWSSLPVGGESSHCVLTAHRGLPNARLFTDLDQLKPGDIFRLYVLKETLTYQVDQILVVQPNETDVLRIREGKDLCTLVTCTPYGINTHRLLVRGHRITNTGSS